LTVDKRLSTAVVSSDTHTYEKFLQAAVFEVLFFSWTGAIFSVCFVF